MYTYGIKNVYRPSQLVSGKLYGWIGGGHSPIDVPSQWVDQPANVSSELLKQQFAYEWFQSGNPVAGFTGERGLTNPPFLSGAAGRLHPALQNDLGLPARILRGYIRRAEYDLQEPMSMARLYFMYNPETITREYVSYLEQSALDPFNTVYQSKNAIAPPSILNFSFELFFDRQEEAIQAGHPGVYVDYQFFDLVVRNVVPSDPNQTSDVMPDNGVMMVNPRDITVVFSPQLTVQGRPTNARVHFEKFTHRMVPTRMRIQLQILASYFGPVRDMVEYKQEELEDEKKIPIDEIAKSVFDLSFSDVDGAGDHWAGMVGGVPSLTVAYGDQVGQANDANHQIRKDALAWASSSEAKQQVSAGLLSARLITEAYVHVGHAETMGWSNHPSISTIMATTKQQTSVYTTLDSFDWRSELLPGDILISEGGVIAFFVKYDNDNCVVHIDPGPGDVVVAGVGRYTHLLRPTPFGSLGSAAQAGAYNGTPSNVGATSGVLTKDQTVVAMTGLYNDIRLSPAALPAWNAWRQAWNGPIPCTTGWRDAAVQQASWEANPSRFAPATSSYHCKGLAVDVNNVWLQALSASEQTRLRTAAASVGWGQARWRKAEGPVSGYECPCNHQKGTKTDEPWHFSWGGCG